MVDFEEQELIKILEEEFKHKVIDYWTPAKDCYEHGETKHCLLVRFENQNNLIENYKDFEFELYLKLKDRLEEFNHYEMVALL